jgi:DNA-binding MarR family transcriptional regulator
MSRKRESVAAAGPEWLTDEQRRAWLAYIRIQLRLSYEMNRQLQADSNLSLADYDVLVALSGAEDGRMQVTALAAQIGWERSRLSHHVRRMSKRGLVHCELAVADRRATDISLSDEGWRAIAEAAPGHVDLVRRLFFGGLPETLLGPLTSALEGIYDNILEQGSLPPPFR